MEIPKFMEEIRFCMKIIAYNILDENAAIYSKFLFYLHRGFFYICIISTIVFSCTEIYAKRHLTTIDYSSSLLNTGEETIYKYV